MVTAKGSSLAVAVALICAGGFSAVSGSVSAETYAWSCALAVACGAALLALRRATEPAKLVSQILYETEHAERKG